MKKTQKEIITSTPTMEKPPFKVGDIVTVSFLNSIFECKILSLKKNQFGRWSYEVQDLNSRFKYVYVGYKGSEKFANIL